MTNQKKHILSPGAPLLLAAILDEISESYSSQLIVDELGLAMATHLGLKRTRNEDRMAVARIESPNAEIYTVALVCDGVGGSESGDHAASLTVASIMADLAQQKRRGSVQDLAVALVKRADDLVRKELQGRGATTLVMLLATASGDLVCANVGDSRAYSWNPGSTKLDQVTIDDTIENELKGLPGNGAALIKARGLEGRLSQALGESGRTADELRVQIYPKADFRNGAVIGSDGLWRAARDFESSVAHAATPTDAVRRAIALANWVGGVDNSSIIALENVERLCGARHVHSSTGTPQMTIDLWLSSSKVRILTSNWISEAKAALPRGKSLKQKPKSKPKESPVFQDASQLELESIESNRARPKIEVVTGDEREKS